MNSAPKVSVIIPNYNHAAFLPKRIESVLNQTFQDFEVIFLDDASTDDSLEVFERYAADGRIRSVLNEVNSGSPFVQWRKGLNEARGGYVWIAESDDFADERFLEKLCAVLDANPGVGLVYCQSWLVDGSDRKLFENRRWTDDLDPERWRHAYVNRGRDEIARFLVHKNTIPNASAVLFRRDAALAADAVDTGLGYCGDWLCWIKILLRSDIAYVAESLNSWRQSHTASVRGTIKAVRRMQEILLLLEYLQENHAVAGKTLRQVGFRRYREWLRASLAENIPWSTHREVVRRFSGLLPWIGLIDPLLAPMFLANSLLGRQRA